MAKQSAFELKRKEAREEILAMKEKIPTAWILNGLGKAFKPKSLGYWLSNIVLLNLILLSPWILIGLALKEIEKTIPFLSERIIATEGIIFAVVVAHIAVQIILDDIVNRIVGKISNTDDLSKLLRWLKKSWSVQTVFAFGIPCSLIWIALGVISNSVHIRQFVGFGFTLSVVLVGLLVGIIAHIYIWMCLLASNLKTYQYDMNAFSPADSEIISDISETLTKSMYTLAAINGFVTFASTSSPINPQTRAIFSYPLVVVASRQLIVEFFPTDHRIPFVPLQPTDHRTDSNPFEPTPHRSGFYAQSVLLLPFSRVKQATLGKFDTMSCRLESPKALR